MDAKTPRRRRYRKFDTGVPTVTRQSVSLCAAVTPRKRENKTSSGAARLNLSTVGQSQGTAASQTHQVIVLPQCNPIFPFCSRVAAIRIATSIDNSDCALRSNFCALNSHESKRCNCIHRCIAHISTYSRLRRVRYTACNSRFHLGGMVKHDQCCSPPRRRHLIVGREDSGTICLFGTQALNYIPSGQLR